MRTRAADGRVMYGVWLSEGIFEPPHPKRIGHALFLFAFLERRVTKTQGRDGLVLGGRPVPDGEVASHMGLSPKTIARQRARLLSFGYIAAKRTGAGYAYTVRNSKKSPWVLETKIDGSGRSDHPKASIRSTEVADQIDGSGRSRSEHRVVTSEQQAAVAAAAANHPGNRTPNPEAWPAVGLDRPTGPPGFQRLWESAYANRNGDALSAAMGKCLDGWEAIGERKPAAFCRAIERVRSCERERGGAGGARDPLAAIRAKPEEIPEWNTKR